MLHLLGGHGHQEGFVQALGQLAQHLLLGAPQQDRRQGFGDLGKVAIADHLADFVHVLMLGQETEGRSQAEAVDELDDRVQFSRRFSSGVPVSTMACSLGRRLTARAARVFQFLMRWASSSTIRSGAQRPIASASRWITS